MNSTSASPTMTWSDVDTSESSDQAVTSPRTVSVETQSYSSSVTYNSSITMEYDVDVDEFLQQQNDQFTRLVLPAIVYLAVLGIIGVVGNTLVLYIYNQKLRKGTLRWFVQALAVFDLLSCLVAIPGEIFDMRNNYTFGHSPMCKVLRTVNMFCTVASGVTLIVVAVERYKRICTPLRKHLTPKWVKVVIAVSTVSACVCAAPASFIYGRQTTPTSHPLIHGSDCSTADVFIGSLVPLAFSAFQALLFFGGAITLIVLYSFIGRKVLSHERYRREGFGTNTNTNNKRMSYIFTGSECSSPTTDDTLFAFPIRRQNNNNNNDDSTEEGSSSVGGNNHSSNDCLDSNNTNKRSSKCSSPLRQTPTSPVSNSKHGPVSERSVSSSPSSKTTEGSPLSKTADSDSPLSKTSHTADSGLGDDTNKSDSHTRSSNGDVQHCSEDSHGCDNRSPRASSTRQAFEVSGLIVTIPEHEEERANTNSCEKISKDASDENADDYLEKALPEQQSEASTENAELESGEGEQLFVGNNNMKRDKKTTAGLQQVSGHDHSNVCDDGKASDDAAYNKKSDNNICKKAVNNSPSRSSDCENKWVCGDSEITSNTPVKMSQDKSVHEEDTAFSDDTNKEEKAAVDNAMKEKKTEKVRPSLDCSVSPQLSEDASERPQIPDTPVSVPGTPGSIDFPSWFPDDVETRRFLRRSVSRQQSSEPPTPTGDLSRGFDTFRKNKSASTSSKVLLRDRHRSGDSTGSAYRGRRYQRRPSLRRQSDARRLQRSDSMRSGNHGTRRTTLMLFLITLIYLLSFLPYIILMIMKVLDDQSLSGHGGAWEVAHNVLLRSYFINSMANPIIYSFCSRTFRKEVAKVMSCTCCKCPLYVK